MGSTTTSFGYPATSHRLQQVGSQARGFDAAGNTLSGIPGYETQSARYDARNRLVEIGSGRQAQWRAQYNGRGERVLYAEGDPAPELPERERGNDWKKEGARATVYDEQGQVLSWLHSGRKLSFEEIIWIDSTPVGRVTSSTSAVTEVHAIHTDHLNTPRALVNAQTQGGQPAGTVVWRWRLVNQGPSGSNAFGAMAAEEDPDGNGTTVRFDLRFPGQQYDASTGLHYNYFRDYEAGTGRYVESDPIGLRGGVGTYGYSLGNPALYFDPYGLFNVTAAEVPTGREGEYEWVYQFSFSGCLATATLWLGENTIGRANRGMRAFGSAMNGLIPEPSGDVDVAPAARRCECLQFDGALESVFSRYAEPGSRIDEATAALALNAMERELKRLRSKCEDCSYSDYYNWSSILSNARERGARSIHRRAREL